MTAARPLRRILIVSPHFPPVNAPDHQRVRTSLPYFRSEGWEPEVLAVDAARVESQSDPLLEKTLPADVPIHRVGALPARLTRLAGLGNLAYRAWSQLHAAGARLLRTGRFDLVYFSTTQFVATALGARWRKQFGVPFVVDIQDPWRTDYYERPGSPPPPGGWKYRFARWQAARLEERAWRDASGFVSVSPVYLEQLRARYPWFAGRPADVIPFGAPEADFAFVRQHPEIPAAFRREPDLEHFVSVGAIGPIMQPAMEAIFAGLAAWRSAGPDAAAKCRLHFIGTSYAPAGRAVPSVQPIAARHGVGDLVIEQPERAGYFTALQTLLAADALLLPGSDDPGYSPSKIGACFLAQRPVLAVMPAAGAAAARVRALQFAELVAVGAPDAVTRVAGFFEHVRNASPVEAIAGRNVRLFASEDTAQACTRRQCALFERALARRP
ncbi:MAG TPA: glycosyltransferase [Opitutus sp.]|nr:glycosyltransferase [Opitutus sp.]